MPTNDNGNPLIAIIQSQIEQVLTGVRDQRKEIADIMAKMVTKDDLRENKSSFNDKFAEINDNLKNNDEKIDTVSVRVDKIETSNNTNSEFIKSIRSGTKWFFGAIFLALLSAIASLIPTWWQNTISNHNTTPPSYVSGQPLPQDTFPTPLHVKIHSP